MSPSTDHGTDYGNVIPHQKNFPNRLAVRIFLFTFAPCISLYGISIYIFISIRLWQSSSTHITDIGFKRIFGQEVSKPVLITFLNCLLEGEHHIVDLKFLDKKQPGESVDDKSLIYMSIVRQPMGGASSWRCRTAASRSSRSVASITCRVRYPVRASQGKNGTTAT